MPGLAAAYREREVKLKAWSVRDPNAEWDAQWWFADTAALRANDFNLSAGRYRPMSQVQAAHQDPRVLLAELAAIEVEIAEEVEALRAVLEPSS